MVMGFGRFLVVCVQCFLGLLFVLTVSFGILQGYRWITSHEFFRMETLIIQGGHRLDSDEIMALGGVSKGSNVLAINIAEVQRRIAASDWVESVSVTRILPGGLTIDIKEREPFFLVRRGDHLCYADAAGRIITPVSADKFISLPLLEKEEGVSVSSGVALLLDETARNALPFGMSQIAWVRQDSAEQFSLFLEKPRVLIQLDGTSLHDTLRSLIRLWTDLESQGELERTASMFVTPERAWIKLDPVLPAEES
jgi:cell division protein FtsQ